MITQEQIKATIERAEKQKQELQELIDSLSTVEAKQDGRVPKDEPHWVVNNIGTIGKWTEQGHCLDDMSYELGNYYLTPGGALRAEKQIRLYRLLDRFSRQNGWTDEIWEDERKDKWYIYYSQCGRTTETGFTRYHRDIGQVYFASEAIAQQAIKKYRKLIMEAMSI